MVPWHPPCALVSLIFSSLDPETNCCYFEVSIDRTFVQPLLRIATGLHIESLFVQLSRCKAVPASFSKGFLPFSVRFANPESDTDSKRILKQLPMRRCASTDLPRGNSACSATLLPCFIHPVGGSYGRLVNCLAIVSTIG